MALSLGACEGVGIPSTDDPYAKLSLADHLWRDSGRVMRARQQVDQAVVIFEQRGDKAGLAEAYRQYALIARIGGMNPDPVVLIQQRNAPIKPTLEELDLSDGYLMRTVALATDAKRFDLVANANFLLGNNQVMRGDPQKACPFYDRALAATRDARTQKPDIVFDLPPGFHSIEEGLGRAKKEAGCPPA